MGRERKVLPLAYSIEGRITTKQINIQYSHHFENTQNLTVFCLPEITHLTKKSISTTQESIKSLTSKLILFWPLIIHRWESQGLELSTFPQTSLVSNCHNQEADPVIWMQSLSNHPTNALPRFNQKITKQNANKHNWKRMWPTSH